MKKANLLLWIAFLALFISSCEYKWIEPSEVNISQEEVSFKEDVVTVFQDKCIQCHSSQSPVLTSDKAFSNLTEEGYVNVDNPKSSELYEKVEEGHPGGNNALNAEELAIILAWIQQGAKNN